MKFFMRCLTMFLFLAPGFTAVAQQHDLPDVKTSDEAGPYVYLRCYSTSYELDDKSLMERVKEDVYTIGYVAEENLLLSSGEACVFTVTDVKGEITENTVDYVADLPFLSTVAPGEFYTAIPATDESGPFFRLQYESTFGEFGAVFFLKEKQFGFSPMLWFR